MIQHLWSIRRQWFGYCMVGGSAFVLDMSTLFFLKEYFGLRPVVAVVINQILIVNFVFFLNKYYSFQSQGQTRRQITRFYLLALWNYAFAIFWMWMLNEKFGFNYLWTRVSGIMLAVCWNFLLYKHWVYKN